MKTELPDEVRKAFMSLEHRVTHLEDALTKAVRLLHATGHLDADDDAEFQAGLTDRRERFKQSMTKLSLEESEWSQVQDYDEHEACGPASS
ncbi:hypothetical protein ACPXCO_24100 [Streptomyces cyaneofuscatus]|uniref:hypothetical protein n=1 Tax=Streptomyces cyaneofuscatus TaxID=66883 RepID=UPI003CE6A958